MKINNFGFDNDIYRQGWSKWVLDRHKKGIHLTDYQQNLSKDYWDCKKAYTAGWREGHRCLDANEQVLMKITYANRCK